MKQKWFKLNGIKKWRKKTRKDIYLEEMYQIIMTKVIEPYYLEPRGACRRPVDVIAHIAEMENA